MNNIYKVFAQTDLNDNIIAVNSSAFVDDSWGIYIGEGISDKYHHAQNNYFDKSIMTMQGIYRYKLINNVVVEKSDAEIAAETPQPTPSELRENTYNTEPCITWDNKQITVTQAAILWAYYSAEGDSVKAGQLQSLISTVKAQIRLQYPD